ncbi:MAG: GNAT family N-acetyltransferase [Candidatus Helarchaeota archaeon]|nr:GNAT family N-acetyltransferase [Candidatus Helarchaeota archaeon]
MNFKVKQLVEPFPLRKIADVLYKTYYEEYVESGAVPWDERYAKYYFDVVIMDISKNFIFGAYKGEKLIGTLFGHRESIMLDNELRLETLNLGLCAVDPEYWHQGVAKAMLSKLIEKATKDKIDFLMAFPEKGRFGDKLLKEHFDFKKYSKNKHLLKIMEERGLQVLREDFKINPILVKIGSLYSHIPQFDDLEGTVRDAQIKDYPKIVDLINSYQSRVPLSTIYELKRYEKHHKNTNLLNSLFGDPSNFYSWVLEDKNEIKAVINNRIELVTGKYEDELVTSPIALLTSAGFHEDMDREQKINFISCILRKIRTIAPSVFTTYITTCHHEMKVFRKLKFISDRSHYILCMKPLTEKGEEINRHRKYKEFFLDYYR